MNLSYWINFLLILISNPFTNGYSAILNSSEPTNNYSKLINLDFLNCLFNHETRYLKIVILTTTKSKFNSKMYSNLYQFTESLLKGLHKSYKYPILVQHYDLEYEDPIDDISQLYTWSGEKFPIRPTQQSFTKSNSNRCSYDVLRKDRTKLYENCSRYRLHRILSKIWDESEFSVIILIDSLQILDQYLFGFPRQPFHTPKRKFIIIDLFKFQQNAIKTVGASFGKPNAGKLFGYGNNDNSRQYKGYWLLAKLWNFYGILNVSLIYYEKMLMMTYNPFQGPDTEYNADGFNIQGLSHINCTKLSINSPKKMKLNGYKLKVVYFYRDPTAIPWHEFPKYYLKSKFGEASKYCLFGGFDGIIFGNIIKELNFTPVMKEVVRQDRYGKKYKSGVFEGTVGDILYGKATVPANSRFIMDLKTPYLEFLHPISTDELCIIAPKALRIPQYLAHFKCFRPMVWALIFITFIFYGFIWQLYKILIYSSNLKSEAEEVIAMNDKKPYDWCQTFINVLLIMTNGTMAGFKFIRHSEKCFILGLLIFSLIINGIFEGSLVTSFSTITYTKDLQTLEDVKNSGFKIVLSSKSLNSVFKSTFNDTISKLKTQVFIDENFTKMSTALYRNHCFLDKRTDFEVTKLDYILPDGTKLLHRVQECPSTYHSAFFIRKGWPLTDTFNWVISAFYEGGFYKLWWKQDKKLMRQKKLRAIRKLNENYNVKRPDRPFTLSDMRIILYGFVIGSIISILVFIGEILYGKYLNKYLKNNEKNQK